MQQKKMLKIIINSGQPEEASIEFDERFLDYKLLFISREAIDDLNEPMRLDSTNVKSLRPLQTAKQFLQLQNYIPEKVIKVKPINTSIYKDLVTDVKYYEFFKKFTDLKNSEEACELFQFAKYTQFDILYDAVGAAIAVNYFVGNTEAQINKFMEDNRLDKLTPSQKSQIMDQHSEIFEKIQERCRQGHLNSQAN